MNLFSLVLRNLSRNKLRTILTSLSVFVALFLFCSLRGVLDTLEDTIQVSSEQRVITRNKASLVFPLPLSYLERIRALDGVEAVSWSNWFGGLDPVDPGEFTAQFAVDSKTYFPMYARDIEIVEPSPASSGASVPAGMDPRLATYMAERTAAVVGEGLMKKRGWKLGQTIRLNGTIYPGSWPFTIRAVYRPRVRAIDDQTIFFHWEYLYENSNQQAAVGIYNVALANPDRASDVGRAVDAMFENSTAPTRTETERAFQAGFVSMLGNVPFVVRLIGGAITFAIFCVAAVTMMMAIRERTGEYAVLKTLGFRNSTIFQLVLAEAALITLIAGSAGAVLAKFALESSGFRIPGFPPMIVHWSTVAFGVFLAALMGAVSGLIPAWQAARLSIVDALRRVA
jgi:putative ABC transport system permease protein